MVGGGEREREGGREREGERERERHTHTHTHNNIIIMIEHTLDVRARKVTYMAVHILSIATHRNIVENIELLSDSHHCVHAAKR